MRLTKFSTLFFLASSLTAAPLAAQDQRVTAYVFGGGIMPLANLQQTTYPGPGGTQLYRQFSSGIGLGAGLYLWLDNNLGLRGEASYASSKVSSPESDAKWAKMFFGGDIVLRSGGSGLAPFAYFGLGVVRMDESGSRTDAVGVIPVTTRPSARVGAGLNYRPDGAPLGFFAEVAFLAYDFNQTRFPFYDKVQTDVAGKVGVTLSF